MSVSDSREERQAAEAKIAALDSAQLRIDLEYWLIAAIDHQAAIQEARGRVHEAIGRYEEAQLWTSLVAAELRRRRPGADVPRETIPEGRPDR